MSAVVPHQQVLPLPAVLPPDHRAAGLLLPGLPEHAAVPPGPLAAVGSQLEVPLGDAQVRQGEGPRAGQPHPDGPAGLTGEPVALPVHGGGGVPDGLYPGPEPFRGVLGVRGQLLRGLSGAARRLVRMGGGAHGDDAHQLLLRREAGGAAVFVVGSAHPAGPQTHGLGGEHQLLAVEAALFLQVRVPGGAGQEEVIPGPPDPSPAFGQGGEGRGVAADQPDMQAGAEIAGPSGLLQLLALGGGEGLGGEIPAGGPGENGVGQGHKRLLSAACAAEAKISLRYSIFVRINRDVKRKSVKFL